MGLLACGDVNSAKVQICELNWGCRCNGPPFDCRFAIAVVTCSTIKPEIAFSDLVVHRSFQRSQDCCGSDVAVGRPRHRDLAGVSHQESSYVPFKAAVSLDDGTARETEEDHQGTSDHVVPCRCSRGAAQ